MNARQVFEMIVNRIDISYFVSPKEYQTLKDCVKEYGGDLFDDEITPITHPGFGDPDDEQKWRDANPESPIEDEPVEDDDPSKEPDDPPGQVKSEEKPKKTTRRRTKKAEE